MLGPTQRAVLLGNVHGVVVQAMANVVMRDCVDAAALTHLLINAFTPSSFSLNIATQVVSFTSR